MTVIAFPVIPRKPRAVPDTPATVVCHPKTIGEMAVDAIEEIEQDRPTEDAMAMAYRDLDLAILKLTAVAITHRRQTQAVTMVTMALERMRRALA